MKCIPLLFLSAALIAANTATGAEPEFPFMPPWDDASPSVTNMSPLLDKPAGKEGFVVVKDGHFFTGGKRIRFFGVNTAFGANFPTHADAEKIAARMAKFGINCVRFHHMDMHAAPGGILSADMRTLDAGQLDKLDYFIAQLKANGIYTDLNLHVSRTYPGMPQWEGAANFCKGVDNFYPPMLAMQRDYARDLLKHVNPYTKTAYTDEPAVAIVEINNENGLICEWWGKRFDNLPDPYRADLATRWNRWLQVKYPSQEALQKAWSAADEPLGAQMFREGDFANGLGSAWHLEQHKGAQAEVLKGDAPFGSSLCVNVKKSGAEAWHVQFSQSKISFVQGKPYTLVFRAAAGEKNQNKRITVMASQAHDPWKVLWSTDVKLTSEWKEYRFTVHPSASETDARIVFGNMGTAVGDYRFADVSLQPGGVFGLQKGETLGAMPIFSRAEYASRGVEVQRDWTCSGS